MESYYSTGKYTYMQTSTEHFISFIKSLKYWMPISASALDIWYPQPGMNGSRLSLARNIDRLVINSASS